MRCEVASSASWPKVMVPRHQAETTVPLLPSLRYCIGPVSFLLAGPSLDGFGSLGVGLVPAVGRGGDAAREPLEDAERDQREHRAGEDRRRVDRLPHVGAAGL